MRCAYLHNHTHRRGAYTAVAGLQSANPNKEASTLTLFFIPLALEAERRFCVLRVKGLGLTEVNFGLASARSLRLQGS